MEGIRDKAVTSELVRRLFNARESAIFQQALPHQLEARNLDEAYRIQESVHAIRSGSVAAYKVGLTNLPAQQACGAQEPIVGRLAACDLRSSPASIYAAQHLRIVEAEFVFELGKDLDPLNGPYTAEKIVGAISGVYAGIEVCNSRFGPEDVSLPCLVADNSNADLLVIGDKFDGVRLADLAKMPVALSRSGKSAVNGSGANVLGDPLNSFIWLANWLLARGTPLKRGQFVASGSCTGITEMDLGEQAIATFGGMGVATVEFVRPQ
jgi:2-keto-4-pentenoate hydratase